MIKQYHPFHLVNQSPWPLTGAIGGMIMLVGLIELIYIHSVWMLMTGVIIMILTMYQWWRDVIREATFQGHHTSYVNEGMRLGMILFIVSEIMFFFSFFWTFFHSSLSPAVEIGMSWPPLNIKMFNPLSIPLLNTLILISSGVTVTWSHHSIINNNFKSAKNALLMTVILGIYFSILQGWEYFEAPFSFSDSCFGSTFFMATGFHGLHVIIGSMFLLISLSRLSNYHYNLSSHFGFEAAAWYWHFVDVVWLFLYISIYWWGK